LAAVGAALVLIARCPSVLSAGGSVGLLMRTNLAIRRFELGDRLSFLIA
jgi:hypothetical protein